MTSKPNPTVEDFYDDDVECWNCGGEGSYACCFEEFACIDPESGCEDCMRRCEVCEGKGHFPQGEPSS